MIYSLLDTACQQGFLYAIAVFGIVISLRILHWPDLTVDGSFTLGGAVVATMLVAGHGPWAGLGVAAIAGFLAGTTTVLLNRKLGISKILAGILVMLMLYSLNLRIMGKANISLLRTETLFSGFDGSGPENPARLGVFLGIAMCFLVGLLYLMVTRLGLFIRATGDNEFMVRSQGVNTDWLWVIGIGLANSLVAVSGAFVAQNQGFADISMGTGLIITGIAALIIGEGAIAILASGRKLLGWRKTEFQGIPPRRHLLPWVTFGDLAAGLIGAFTYFLIVGICLRMGLAPTDLKLATGVLVIVGIAFQFKGATIESYTREKL